MNKYNDIDDYELISLLPENPDEIKSIIYEKYKYIVDIIIKKYSKAIKTFQVDEMEVRQEALYGLNDGINSYVDDKNASLKTFLSLCISRRVYKYITKWTSKKNLIINEAISLDEENEYNNSLINLISDNSDPLKDITSNETINEILSLAKKELSAVEYKVFMYRINDISCEEIAKKMDFSLKQVYNALARIKAKLKDKL